MLLDLLRLKAGQQWRQEIHTWLSRCHGAVILFSKNAYEDSDWVLKEATILSWRRTLDPTFLLIPVLLPPVVGPMLSKGDYEPLALGETQSVDGSNPAAALKEILEELRPLKKEQPETPLDEVPAFVEKFQHVNPAPALVRRKVFVITLVGAGLVVAIVRVRRPQEAMLPDTTTVTLGTTVPSLTTQDTMSTAHDTISTTTTHVVKSSQQPSPPPEPVIRDATGRSVYQLVSAAKSAIDTTRHRVEGTLSASTVVESDERLKGIVTASMSLEITVTTRGALTTAFTIESRGGGFTETAALNQARDRLAATLRERLRHEVLR